MSPRLIRFVAHYDGRRPVIRRTVWQFGFDQLVGITITARRRGVALMFTRQPPRCPVSGLRHCPWHPAGGNHPAAQ